jgi:hypothetical protein
MLVRLDDLAGLGLVAPRASRETDGARSTAVLARLLSSIIARAWSGHRSSLHRFVMAALQSAVKAGSGKEVGRRTGFCSCRGPGEHLPKLS